MSKTLSESAAEILQASMMAGKEPAAALTVAQDLGGQTPESMDAGSVGSNAAVAVKQAPKPGVEGEIYIETYRGEDARHRVSTCRHPIWSESLTSSDVLHHAGS